MIIMQGMLFNIFKTKGGTRDDGTAYEGKHKIQLLTDVSAEDGTTRKDIVDLSVEDTTAFTPLMNKEIQIEIGVFSAKSQTIFFCKKGSMPTVVNKSNKVE